MTEETFWELIDELDGVIDDDSVDALTERLSSLPPEDVEGFCAHLAAKVGALAGLPLEGLSAPDVSDAGGAAPPLVGDALENLLYTIVAAGRASYESVLADPSAVEEQEWDAGEAELLMDAAARCLWEAAGVDWSDEYNPLTAPFSRDDAWYETFRGSAWKGMPRQYAQAAHDLDRKLNQSEEWRAWWRQSALRKIKVTVTVNGRTNRDRVSRGRNIAKATFERDRTYFADRDPGALRILAIEETAHITAHIAAELHLPPPPALP